MPYKEPKIEKIVFPIGEVAKMLNVETTVIRYWENQFEALKPQKNKRPRSSALDNTLFLPLENKK